MKFDDLFEQRTLVAEKLKKCIHVGVLNFVHFPDNELSSISNVI